MADATRAEQLRNIDAEGVCHPAESYIIGTTDDGEIVIVPETSGKHFGIFLDAEKARDFLDRFTAEMQAMGFLS